MTVFIPPTIDGNARRDRALYTPVLVKARNGRDKNFFAYPNEYNRLLSQKISERSKKTFMERNGRTIGRNVDDLGSPGVSSSLL